MVVRHPFTCRCAKCVARDPVGYVRGGTAAQMAEHMRLLRDQERRVRLQGSWHGWHATLLRWAAAARLRAAAEQMQREMFGRNR